MRSSDFGVDVLENWQSEYLQFSLYILATVWLLQRGSPESKPLGEAGGGSDRDQRLGAHAGDGSPRWARLGGTRTWVYSNSLGLAMIAIWPASWLGQSRDRPGRLQRGAVRPPRGGRHLPAPARLAGVQAGRRAPRRDRVEG